MRSRVTLDVTVAESEPRVLEALDGANPEWRIRRSSMLAIKGLERACVVFSDRATSKGAALSPEWIYTALTRSRALLVLVLSEDAPAANRAVVGRLGDDRLLFWDETAADRFAACKALVGTESDPLALGVELAPS